MQTPPVLKARLVHAEPGQRVVELSAWQGEHCLGSCLGEAASAEEAEERAHQRLLARLGSEPVTPLPSNEAHSKQPFIAGSTDTAVIRHPVVRQAAQRDEAQGEVNEPVALQEGAAQTDLFTKAPQAALVQAVEPPADPEDWSDELAELDVQLQRIGWDRSHESLYLQRAFGHPNRNRLTAYADLVTYLRCLRNLPTGSDANTASVPLRRKELLEQSDELLQSLRWDAHQGRQLLEQQFQLNSRQQLSDEQLLQFNMLLEEALIQASQKE